MRRTATVALLAGFLLAVASPLFAVNPAALNRVTFVNNTGFEIIYLFFSPGDSDYWGADILGTTRTLGDGEKVGFFIHYPDYENEFDFLAIDEDGDAYIIWDYVVSDDGPSGIEITLNDLEGGYDLPRLATVNLANESGYDIWYTFFSPGDSRMWGVDMLDDETILEAGEKLNLFVPVGSDPIRYDCGSVDEDEDFYQFTVELSDARTEYTWAIELSDLQ